MQASNKCKTARQTGEGEGGVDVEPQGRVPQRVRQAAAPKDRASPHPGCRRS